MARLLMSRLLMVSTCDAVRCAERSGGDREKAIAGTICRDSESESESESESVRASERERERDYCSSTTMVSLSAHRVEHHQFCDAC